jgi:hypothetical protein
MVVALQDAIAHIVKRHTEGTERKQIVSACKNHENVSACDVHSIYIRVRFNVYSITTSSSRIFIKGCPRYVRKIHLQRSAAQCKAVTRRKKTEKVHGFPQWKPCLGLPCKNDSQPFPQMPSILFLSFQFIVYLCPPSLYFIVS